MATGIPESPARSGRCALPAASSAPRHSPRLCSWFVASAGDQPRSDGGPHALALDMPVLLRPELAIDGAALDERRMRSDIHHLAPVQDENLVAFDERGEAMRHDDHR